MKWSQLFVIVDIILYIKKIKMKYSDVNLTKWSLPCARKMLKSQPVSHSHGLDVSVFVEFIHLFSTYLSDHLVYITFFL